MVTRGGSTSSASMGIAHTHTDQNNTGSSNCSDHQSSADHGSKESSYLPTSFLSRTLSSTFSSFSSLPPSSPTTSITSPSSQQRSRRSALLKKSNIRKSLRRLDSSHRLSVTCSGSDLSQLYLSGPEQDAIQILSSSSFDNDDDDGVGLRRQSSWLQSADLFGRRKSFRRMTSYARFLDDDIMSEIAEFESMMEEEEEEESMLLIEEMDGSSIDEYRSLNKVTSTRKCLRRIKSPAVVIPVMMIVDLIVGVSLSLYDSNLLRNVPGFRFPLCYAFTQKMTNAMASLVLICLSRRWEREERERVARNKHTKLSSSLDDDQLLFTELPSIQTFRQHMIPLTAVALVQTISAAFANQALQIIPLPLFKVCLMCGPIFVAFMTKMVEGQLYSKGRMLALGLIGVGACRAVYAEAEGADNPRYIMEGAGYALGASAFSGIGLVLSSALMHRGGNEQEEDGGEEQDELLADDAKPAEVELNPLSLLFYLSCEQVFMLSAYLCPWDVLLQQQDEGELEEPGEFAAFTIYFANNPWTTICYLMMGSTMSLFLAVLTFVLVNRTSPVATSLLGNARSIATVAISSVVFGNVSGAAGLFGSAAFGYLLTLAGGVAYALAALGRDASPSK